MNTYHQFSGGPAFAMGPQPEMWCAFGDRGEIRMKALHIVLMAAMLAVAGPVSAQVDPGPNGLGFYADQGGLTNRLETPPGFIEVYLLGAHVTAPLIKGWATRVELTGNAFVTKFDTPYPHDLIYGNPDLHSFEYIVTAYPNWPPDETGLAGGPIVYLATLVLYVADSQPVDLYVQPFEGMFPGSIPLSWYYYYKGSELFAIETEFRPSTGSWDVPVMSINGPAAIPTTPCTWGGVRALYR